MRRLMAFAAMAVALGCGPGRYELRRGPDVAEARVRFKAFIPDFDSHQIEYDVLLRDGDTCKALGKVDLERYTGSLFGSNDDKARADYAASALALQMPGSTKIDSGTIAKELRVAAGKPIVVEGSHFGPPANGWRRVCEAENRFVPEAGADYEVEFRVFSVPSADVCAMSIARLVAGPDGKVQQTATSGVGPGCLKRD